MCIGQGGAEVFTRLNYGDPEYDHIFKPMLLAYPEQFTISEDVCIVKLFKSYYS